MYGAIMFLNGTGLTIFRSLFCSEKTFLMVWKRQVFLLLQRYSSVRRFRIGMLWLV